MNFLFSFLISNDKKNFKFFFTTHRNNYSCLFLFWMNFNFLVQIADRIGQMRRGRIFISRYEIYR
jgi:hypothetical protein